MQQQKDVFLAMNLYILYISQAITQIPWPFSSSLNRKRFALTLRLMYQNMCANKSC